MLRRDVTQFVLMRLSKTYPDLYGSEKDEMARRADLDSLTTRVQLGFRIIHLAVARAGQDAPHIGVFQVGGEAHATYLKSPNRAC